MPKTVRTRAHSLREIFDATFYVLKTGCPWRLLPHDFPPWQTVFYHFRGFRLGGLWHLVLKILCTAERERVSRNPGASAAVVDGQSVRTAEESAQICGYDAKNVKGRKRHLLVETLGLPLSIYIIPADVQDRTGMRCLLARQMPSVEQGLRAQGPDQPGPARGGYDSPNVEAAGEFSAGQQRIDYSV